MALVLGLGTGIAPAQNSTSSVPLGDLARQLKAQRAKSGEKSKVFTNDDLAALSPSTTAKKTSGNEAGKESAKAPPAETGEQTHGEKYYRERMSKLQDRLQIDQRELSVLEQKLGQNQMQYYPDPNKGLLQESGPTALSDIHKLQDQIDKKKAEIAADQEAIDDLREQLRREGGDAAWLPAEASAGQTSEARERGQAANEPEKPENKKGTKQYWQSRFKSARARLADAEERQQLAEDELNLLQIQDVRELNSNVKAEIAAKIKAKEDEVSGTRAATEEARKTLENLENEFKASGAPDEWSETETQTPE
jgi:chromosome segregation ATPase